MHDMRKGVLYALSAAALNATIGVLSKFTVAMGFPTHVVAALKTVIGFVIVGAIGIVYLRPQLRGRWLQAALCAFFGIFVLFFFETAAYAHEATANVVVTLMAFAAFSAVLLGWPVLGDRPGRMQALGLCVALVGVALVSGVGAARGLDGLALAAVAGIGYGVFSVMVKKFGLAGGFALTARLLFFGSIYLGATLRPDDFAHVQWSAGAVVALLLLALFPTILGFVCTTRAIQYIAPGRVQTLELAEPVFAGVFALIFLHEVPGLMAVVGGAVVIAGLYLSSLRS